MMRKKFRIKLMLRTASHKRKVASFLLLIFLIQTFAPTTAFALTGGPSQPEVQSFEPIGTSDMVDLSTGDFNYNIPLLDMDGYPINIGYHSGITMDQEASWVGLGWNINPGVINRGMRGIPDDFKGEEITKELNLKPNRTFGVNGAFRGELFGVNLGKINISLGIKYNNYNGMGMEKSLSMPISSGSNSYGSYNTSLGISSSSDNGLSVQPEVGLSATQNKLGITESSTKSLGLKVGTALNSRAGLSQLTISTSLSISKGEGVIGMLKKMTGFSENTSHGEGGASAAFNFGSPTYTPQVTMPMMNYGINANFTFGGALFGAHGNYTVGGYFSSQRLYQNTMNNPAYGYLYSEQGQDNVNSILDFNREKDGSFTTNTPALHQTNFTYDMLSVSGQGIGGSYRPFRNEVAYVFDPAAYSFSNSDAIGVELGIGNAAHNGFNYSTTNASTNSGAWTANNYAIANLKFKGKNKGSLVEHFNFAEANEKVIDANNDFFENYGGYDAQRFELKKQFIGSTGLLNKITGKNGTKNLPSTNYKTKRSKRNQTISYLTKEEMMAGLGTENMHVNTSGSAKPHHMNEVTSVGSDGMRYVYGIAAYNNSQTEKTFAIGKTLYGTTPQSVINAKKNGVYQYDDGTENSLLNNNRGIDNYYSSTTTPGYAHSYLLTSVLSTDYSDIDNIKGPSIGDLGNYTKFNYERKHDDYKWRTPIGDHMASYNEGLKADLEDDKANIVEGTKEIWYVKSIESKNYIAIFHLSDRKDGLGVTTNSSTNGAIDPTKRLQRIDSISLFTLNEYYSDIPTKTLRLEPIPIKVVHFEYDYTLCQNIQNFQDFSAVPGEETPQANEPGNGKLTLKKIYFTYQNSKKARLSPYKFNYGTTPQENPNYNSKNSDRWGNFKKGPDAVFPENSNDLNIAKPITNAEFPYSEQNKEKADEYASVWTLKQITLPSGGKIDVNYESDDYGFVQNKRAMQMYQIVGFMNDDTPEISNTSSEFQFANETGVKNKTLLIKTPLNATAQDLTKGVKEVYFRCLANVREQVGTSENDANYDYVSGYSELSDNDDYPPIVHLSTGSDYKIFKINFKATTINDNGDGGYSPIAKATVQFARLYLSRLVYEPPQGVDENTGFGKDLLQAMINSSFVSTITEFAQGPNKYLFKKGIGNNMIANKSFIRLNSPDYKKLGGGVRVKKISLSDEWLSMLGKTDDGTNDFLKSSYGQQYDYTTDGTHTSGVASYEPQLGGDENPWREPVHYAGKKFLAPDDRFYQEKPYGESFFPSPSVVYGKVTVKNIYPGSDPDETPTVTVTKHGTGKVVHEFYTAKDFPTLVELTDLDIDRVKPGLGALKSILKLYSRDKLAATQGFKIETNDMHGKPKSQKVYQEGKLDPITSVEYFYKATPHLFDVESRSTEVYQNTFKLENNCDVINSNGTVQNARIGVFYDMVADMRQSTSSSTTVSLPFNGEGFLALILPVYIVVMIPGYSREDVQFRSASTTKVIQRFGILEKTVAKDLGSVVSTNNLAYDAETGDVLLTQTTTNFNDQIYNLSYPAHWYYQGMGPAYKNIGYERDLLIPANGVVGVPNAKAFYTPGDELAIYSGAVPFKAWVVDVSDNAITLQNKGGGAPLISPQVVVATKILRSGHKNLNSVKISSITTLSNPLNTFTNNVFQNVLQASSIEFSDNWKTKCNCFSNDLSNISSNPYVTGTKGNWRAKRSWLHLSGRKQVYENQNSNIRKDGVFTSYTPFYMLASQKWNIDERNWTYTSEVTEFNPFGQELENKDALGRNSSATFGYKQTMATAVAANTQYRELGFDNFEDYRFSPCADDHFKFIINDDINSPIVDETAHSGRNSIKVNQSNSIVMSKTIKNCKPIGCTITLSEMSATGVITALEGTAPYSFDWDIINGEPNVQFNATGDGIIATSSDNFTIIVTVTDANGCKTIQTRKKITNN